VLQSTFFQSVSQKPSFLETDHFFQSKDIPGISQYKYYKSIPLRMVKSTTGTAPPTKPPGSGPGGVVAPPRAPRPGSGRPPLDTAPATRRAVSVGLEPGIAGSGNDPKTTCGKSRKLKKKKRKMWSQFGVNLGKMYEHVKCSLCWVSEVLCIMIATLLFHVFSYVGHFVSCNEENLWVDTQTSQVSWKSGPLMASY